MRRGFLRLSAARRRAAVVLLPMISGLAASCGSSATTGSLSGPDDAMTGSGSPGSRSDGAAGAIPAGDDASSGDGSTPRAAPGSSGGAPDAAAAATDGADAGRSSGGADAGRGSSDAAPAQRGDATASADAGAPAVGDGGGWWKPTAGGTTWQWQLSGTLDTSLDVAMYDIDLFSNDAQTIAALKARGIKVVCYIDVGTYEPGRPDSSQFPAAALGADVQGWPGEKWLDVTSPAVQSIMQARFQLAQQKGCDGVEPDNVDSYDNSPGFPTTAAQQATYDTWVSSSVHALGMSVALKNDTGQVAQLEPIFDFALVEQCFQYSECATFAPFTRAGKAVFEVEYGDAGLATTICPQAASDHFDTLVKDLDLDAWRVSCE